MSDQSTVGAAILDLLAEAGVDVVFGLPGVHNLPMWSARQPHHPRIIGVRHEQAAVYAADGYARATGRLGVALTTTGPGAANCVAAFGEAASCGSPILVISSDVAVGLRDAGPGDRTRPRGILHEMADQAALFTPFTDRAATARDAASAVALVADALASATVSPTGPSYVGVPSDILAADYAPAPSGPASAVSAPVPTTQQITDLAALAAASPRVAIWAGGGVVQCGVAGEDALREIAEALGAPVVTTYAGRGLLAGHPLVVEAPVHEPEVADLISRADLLLVVGSGFDAMNTRNWRMPLPPATAAVGLDPALPRTIDWDLLIPADLVATLDGVRSALADAPRRTPWAATDTAARLRSRLATDPRMTEALALVDAVGAWPTDGVVVCDMAVAGYWVGGYGVQPRPRRLQYPVGWGTLGYALPAAIGPAAAGIPTLAVCGDGGPMFALGELAALAQEHLPVTLLVVDDGGYGMLRFDQQVFGHPERGVDLLTPDWTQLAAAFALPCTEIGSMADLAAALTDGGSGPRVVVVRARLYPPRTTSPRWFEDAPGGPVED